MCYSEAEKPRVDDLPSSVSFLFWDDMDSHLIWVTSFKLMSPKFYILSIIMVIY